MKALYRISEIKVTGSGSGTAEEARTKTAPLHLATKDVQKGPINRLTGTSSGIAGDALPTTAPLQKILAKDYPLGAVKRPKNDSAVRVLLSKVTHYMVLANSHAQQLPPKAADEPLSFCTHKEKGHRSAPQARSEQQPTGARAYLTADSAVRVLTPPS